MDRRRSTATALSTDLARPRRPPSMLVEKLVPRRAREGLGRDIVWFQIDELNGLYDALQTTRGRPADGALMAARLAGARRRVLRVCAAVDWSVDLYARQAWAFVADGLERDEDSFGAAVILLRIPRDRLPTGVKEWLGHLPRAVQRTLRVLDLVGGSSGGR